MLEQYIINNILRAVAVFTLLLIALRVSISLIERIILKLVKKTKTDLDDIIIKKSSRPITLVLIFISLGIAVKELALSGNLLVNVNSFISSVLIIFIGYLIYIIIDIAIFNIWNQFALKVNIKTGESLASLIKGVLEIIIIVITALYVLNSWGIEITPLLAGLGIAGLAIALALQPTLGHIFSGISMILDKSVKVGDLVYLDDNTKGKINKVGMRSTKIITFDNELVIVPNTKLADSVIQNIALPEPKSRVVIPFGVEYGSDIEKVKQLVMKEVKTIKSVCKDPEPVVSFREMGDSALLFKAYFYVDHFSERFSATDEANTKIYNTLNKNKIGIPFPQMDVHVKKR